MPDSELLLAEELLLLSLDDEKGTDRSWASIETGIAAALLMELTAGGALRLAEGDKIVVGDDPAATDPLLREALDAIRGVAKTRNATYWVSKLRGELKPLRQRVAERLVERGVLGEDTSRVLGVTVSRRYPERDPTPERALRVGLLLALTGERDPSRHEAELISLLRPMNLIPSSVPREHRSEARRRAKQIAERHPVAAAADGDFAAVQTAILAGVAASTAADGGGGGDGG